MGDWDGVAQVLHFKGTVATHQGNFQLARDLYADALAIRRKQGDNARAASLLSNLGIVARLQGQYDQALQLNKEGAFVTAGAGRQVGCCRIPQQPGKHGN